MEPSPLFVEILAVIGFIMNVVLASLATEAVWETIHRKKLPDIWPFLFLIALLLAMMHLSGMINAFLPNPAIMFLFWVVYAICRTIRIKREKDQSGP